MKRIGQYFLDGLLVLVPFVVTIWVIHMVFQRIDGLFSFNAPGLGVLATILLIFSVGFFTSNFLTRKLLNLADMLFSRFPLLRLTYQLVI